MNYAEPFTIPAHMRPGQEGWTHAGWVDTINAMISMRAPLFAEGDDQHRVLVSCGSDGNVRVFCEFTEYAAQPIPTPALVVDFTEVPTITAADLEDTIEWEVDR